MRHGESHANADGVFAGPSYSAPLTEQGRLQAQAEGARIKRQNVTFDRIVSSPIERAKETAEIIAKAIGFDLHSIVFDKRLSEYDMGALSGQPKAGVTPRQRTSAAGAEDPAQFQARVLECLREMSTLPGNTLIVAHVGVAGIIQATELGTDIRDFYNEGYPNAHIVELELESILQARMATDE